MKVHPAAPALWIAAVLTLAITIVGYTFNFLTFDPIMSLLFYFFFNEMSKFIAEITHDGTDND